MEREAIFAIFPKNPSHPIVRKSLTFLICLICASTAFAQRECTLQSAYPLFVRCERFAYEDGFLLLARVDSVRGKHCAAAAIDANIGYFQYLLSHFSSEVDEQAVLEERDSVRMQAAYIAALRQAGRFDSLMTDYSRKVLSHAAPKDTVREKVMLDIAVKYFSIRKITPDGHYAAKVCAGLNDIVATEPVRRPHVEAFCFAAILAHYEGPRHSMRKEMTDAVRELYAINFGIDPAERLLRAQGALYMLMRQNPALKVMLWEEYRARADYLPFVLVP